MARFADEHRIAIKKGGEMEADGYLGAAVDCVKHGLSARAYASLVARHNTFHTFRQYLTASVTLVKKHKTAARAKQAVLRAGYLGVTPYSIKQVAAGNTKDNKKPAKRVVKGDKAAADAAGITLAQATAYERAKANNKKKK